MARKKSLTESDMPFKKNEPSEEVTDFINFPFAA
jgi:hypothetical protein